MASAAEQVTFLLGCIKHTNNGKIDFDALAAELGLTKGAAYKRYTRLKARAQESDLSAGSAPHTPSAGGEDNDNSGIHPTPVCTPKAKRARAAGPKAAASKPATKRKCDQVKSEETDQDEEACASEDNQSVPASPARRLPKRKKATMAAAAIKKEVAAEEEEELHERIDEDRRLQEKIRVATGDEATLAGNSGQAGTSRFVSEEIEIDLGGSKLAAQIKDEEACSNMAFDLEEDEAI